MDACSAQESKIYLIVYITYRPPDCSVTCFSDEFLEKHTLALTYGKEVRADEEKGSFAQSSAADQNL
jgi:hypothetical protein